MMVKAKAVAHDIRAILHVSGKSRNKKQPERIMHICDNFILYGMDASGIWTEMKFATMNYPNIKNDVIHMDDKSGDEVYPRLHFGLLETSAKTIPAA